MNRGLRWYLASSCAFLVPGGIQQVLFPWLIAVYLMESADRLGLAQMASALPSLLLILFGGVIGDRYDQRRILMVIHVLAGLPPLAMAWAITQGALTYSTLIVYALVAGVFGAFSQPARDALLNHVAGREIQRTVTLVVMLGFGVQIVGFAFASFADTVGPAVLMGLQGTVMIIGAAAIARIPPLAPRGHVEAQNPFRAIAEGVRYVIRSPSIMPAVFLTFGMGVFYSGVYIVLLPLLLRDVYIGGSTEISLAFASFMVGTVIMTMLLMRAGGSSRPGRAMILGVAVGTVALLPLLTAPPIWLLYLTIFFWGMSAGVTMAMGRSIVQAEAVTSHRARIMSVYSMGMMGGMPIGSLTMGYAIEYFGPIRAVWLPVIGINAMVLVVCVATRLWHVVALDADRRGAKG
ncbi:MAG: MFS transporter [Gammaproteobacteria bacterium]|nr:MFS transporter [Gammaproteobacteria bacterium]